MTELTQEYLMSRLDYSPFLGIFWYLPKSGDDPETRRWNTQFAEKQAGYLNKGYTQISIDGRRYMAHRLAFFYITGRWPAHEIDHINGDKSDNRWANLREATHAENLRNQTRLRSDNTSGSMGVFWHKSKGKWEAKIGFNGRLINLGCFDDKAEAAKARQAAEKKYFENFAPPR